MHSSPLLKNPLLWYVSLSIFSIASLLLFHLMLVQSSIIGENDAALRKSALTAANVLHLLEAQRASEGEIRSEFEKLANLDSSGPWVEILDRRNDVLFHPSTLDRSLSSATGGDSASDIVGVQDSTGHRTCRVLAIRAGGYTVFAVSPEPTLTEIAFKSLADSPYVVIMFCLFVLFTALFIYGFHLRPLQRLNQRLIRIVGQTPHSDSIDHLHSKTDGGLRGTELTAKMVERMNDSRNQALNFSSFASHELRTPLTIIRNQLEDALSADISNRTLRKIVGGVYDDMLRLNNIVESLLNLSTMQAGTFSLKLENIPVQQFFKKFYDEAFFLTRPKNIAVVLGKGPALFISGDSARLRQVFFNLLDNAVRNTPENHRIHLSYEFDDGDVLIKFADSGNGIPPDVLPRIFEPFVRGNGSANDNQGSGLGLALVKLIVDLHGGSIMAESVVGRGTTFFLRFPSIAPSENTAPAKSPPPRAT